MLSLVLLSLLATTALAMPGLSAFPGDGLVAARQPSASTTAPASIPHIRPPPAQRKFNSTSINRLIANYTSRMIDTDLATLFENCLPCTLDTTVGYFHPRNATAPPDTYVITGDIDAQWLRDSTNQVLPYIAYAAEDGVLKDLVCGLIKRQSRDIVHDPYANSFNFDSTGGSGHQDDTRKPAMTPLVFEGKYELDSLAAALKLAWHYYNSTQDTTCLTEDSVWLDAVTAILATMTAQQHSTLPPSTAPYYFQRTTNAPTDSLMLGGVGNTGRYTGMVKSAFRPSDDSTLFPFFIPANAMAVVELRHVSALLMSLTQHVSVSAQRVVMAELADNATALADTIDAAIRRYGVIQPPQWLKDDLVDSLGAAPASIYAYEVDGYGGQTIMDDANIPSLLALPYLGYTSRTDPLYLATRAVLLSPNNPYYFNGTAGSGIGGPHIGLNYIWPMSLIARALTSTADDEIRYCLETLKASSAGTGWLHESYEKDDVKTYTRPWFAWVNGLYGQLIMQLAVERPHLIFKQSVTSME